MLATVSPEPFASMQRSRDPLPGLPNGFALTQDEAEDLADKAYAVAVEYDLAKYFTGKVPVLVVFGLAVFAVYGPRVVITAATVRAVRARQLPIAGVGPTMATPDPNAANDQAPRPRMNLI